MNVRRGKPALSPEYLDPGRGGMRSAVSRQVVAIFLIAVPIVFAGKALDALGSDDTIGGILALILAGAGAVAGAIYHPVRRFWWRGAVAGVLVMGGAFAAIRAYQRLRPEPVGYEFAVVALVGAIPGIVAYYFLMRHQRVGTQDHPLKGPR